MYFHILDSNDFHHHFWMFGGFPLLTVILIIVGALVITLLVRVVLNAPRWRPERRYSEGTFDNRIWSHL